jgi:hypothetical protein
MPRHVQHATTQVTKNPGVQYHQLRNTRMVVICVSLLWLDSSLAIKMALVLMQSARLSSARRCTVRAQATAKPASSVTNVKQAASPAQVRAAAVSIPAGRKNP